MQLVRSGIGAFVVSQRGTSISATQADGSSREAFHGAILDHVLPRALAHQGHLIAHAGTVAINGRALCLLGPSGTGKSTLTVACEAAGMRLLGDDSVRIVPAEDGARCVSAYPGARLTPDSVASLNLTARVGTKPVGPVPKHRYRPAATPADDAEPLLYPLAALVHLERDPDPAAPLTLTPVPLVEAAALLTAQCFVLDPTDRARIRRLLALTAATVAVVPVYRLRYPSGYEHLPAVCAQLAMLIVP